MPPGEVRSIAEDPLGFMWIGTNGGLCRFDGSRFETWYPNGSEDAIPDSRVNDIVASDSSVVYIATEGGLCSYDQRTGAWRQYPNVLPDSTRRERCETLLPLPDGRLAVCYERLLPSGGGVAILDPISGAYENFTFEDDIGGMYLSLDPENEQVLWFGGWGRMARLDISSGDISYHYSPEGKGKNFIYQSFSHAPAGDLWVPQLMEGVYRFSTSEETWTKVSDEKYLIRVIPFDERTLLGASYRKGLVFIDIESGEANHFPVKADDPFSIPDDDVTWLHRDTSDRIWIGHDKGLCLYDPFAQQFEVMRPPPVNSTEETISLRAMDYSPERDQFVLGCSSRDGIYFLDADDLSVVDHHLDYTHPGHRTDGIRMDRVVFLGPDSVMWTTPGGLYFLDMKSRQVKPVLEADDPVFEGQFYSVLHRLDKHRFMVGGRNNHCFMVDIRTREVRKFEVLDERYNRLGPIRHFSHTDDGKVWLTSVNLCGRLDLETGAFEAIDDVVPNYSASNEGLAVSHIQVNDSMLYRSTQVKGIVRYNLNTGARFSVAHPMGTRYWAGFLVQDQEGFLWCGTRIGLMRHDPVTLQTQWFDKSTGFVLNGSSNARVHSMREGEIFVVSGKYVVRLHPDRFEESAEMPRPYLTDLKVGGVAPNLEQAAQFTPEITLQPGQSNVSFEFGAIAFTNPAQVRYAYRLQGLSEQWSEASGRTYGNYTNLEGGDYVLQLRAAQSNGNWSEPLEVQVIVLTPFYKAWWFYALVMLLAGVLIWMISRFRLRQKHERARVQSDFEKQLAEVEMTALRAQMNPHFLFNCLNSIKYFIIQNRVEEAADYLTKFSRLIRLILNNSKTEMVSLDSELEALDLYIQMEQLRFEDKFTYRIAQGNEVHPEMMEIPPLLIQPFVENAIWHGLMHKDDPGNLEVRLSVSGDVLNCEVQDDGVGRKRAAELKSKQSTRRKSLGMQITSDRVKTINQLYGTQASIEIEDLHENGKAAGTCVRIQIPLK